MTAIVFLVCGHFTRRQTISGELVPSSGLLNITAVGNGTVVQDFIRLGQSVRAGQDLIALTNDIDSPTMGPIDALTIQSLQSQKILLQQDIADQVELVQAQTTDLQDKLASFDTQLAEIQGQIGIQSEQIATTEAVLQKFNTVGNGGFVSGLQMQQQKGTVFSAQAELKELQRDQDQIIQQIDDTRQQLRQLPVREATQRNDTEEKLADIEQSLGKISADQLVVLRAPEAGVVSALIAKSGEAVTAGQPVISITPEGSQLVAQLLVPSSAIGFLHPASRLKLRYDAFPYQEFGQASGTVTSISASALTPAEIASLSEQRSNTPLYQVDVTLDRQSIGVYGIAEPLRAGLTLQASVMLDRRRLIQWVFEPIYDIGRGVFSSGAGAS